MISKYFKDKKSSYRNQDKIAGRTIDNENYVDLDSFSKSFNFNNEKMGHCTICLKPLLKMEI